MEWGSAGSGQGQFDNSRAIAVDHGGTVVYVAERWNHRVQKFTPDGAFLAEFSFSIPRAVAVEPDGTFYVLDAVANTINKFSSGGSLITQWGQYGAGDGQFATPLGICVDGNGNIYVADTYNYRVQKFSNSGQFLAKWGAQGNAAGQFFVPKGVAADGNGNVYVADSGNHRIQKFNQNGSFITQWGTFGGGNGQFSNPYGVAASSSGDVYVSDTFNHRIQKFSSNGTFRTMWGINGAGQAQFDSPQGVAVDVNGTVYTADTENYRVQKFGSSGTQTGISDGSTALSARLYPSTPNPFLHRTQVRFDIQEPGRAKLQVFDFKGRLVNSLTDVYATPGTYSVSWDGRTGNGEQAAAGAYFFRLVTGNTVATQKAFLVR
jgi:sugar lactone lactonase YvrE